MIRPTSIVRYERLYLASFVLGSIVAAMGWAQRTAMVAANPMLSRISWILPTFQLAGIVITLCLWYFTARVPSIAAKWIVVVIAALSMVEIVRILGALATGSTVIAAASILSVLADTLYVAAAILLFKPDAKLWFGLPPDTDAAYEDMPHDR